MSHKLEFIVIFVITFFVKFSWRSPKYLSNHLVFHYEPGPQDSGLAAASPVLHVVLGNEACDVDSVVCSLAYAYFLAKVRLSQLPGHILKRLV